MQAEEKKEDFTQQLSKIKDILIKQRQSLQSLLCAVSIFKSTLHKILKERKVLERISSTTKAKSNRKKKKLVRIRFCLHVQTNACFLEMLNCIYTKKE